MLTDAFDNRRCIVVNAYASKVGGSEFDSRSGQVCQNVCFGCCVLVSDEHDTYENVTVTL